MNYYQVLNLKTTATQTEIKQAYRQLAKLFHPDNKNTNGQCDRIIEINLAYEVLGDPAKRQLYDSQRQGNPRKRETVNYQCTNHQDLILIEQWLKQTYHPVNRSLTTIIKPFKSKINELSADPFDDELVDNFQDYLTHCRSTLSHAERTFRTLPNPRNLATVAQELYYCINQLDDALAELEMYLTSFDFNYLNVGREMFKIADSFQQQANNSLKNLRF